MPVIASNINEGVNNGLVIAAILALSTNWDETETRPGRRGEFQTTGANMIRVRELSPDQLEQVKGVVSALGLDIDEDDIAEVFSGEHEYQVSFACNKFVTRGGKYGTPRLTQNEIRTLERAKDILGSKEVEAARFMTTPGGKQGGPRETRDSERDQRKAA